MRPPPPRRSSSSSSGPISLERSARRVDVDNRISLRNYYRIADSLIRQANIYRAERNVIDLYVTLLRFSSLITETIPLHRDYKSSLDIEKVHFKRVLMNALNELETLKPDVQYKLAELNRKSISQANDAPQSMQNSSIDSYTWPAVRNQISAPVQRVVAGDGLPQGPTAQRDKLPLAMPREDQFRRLLLNIPPPKEETLLRHSILGPNGLQGQWQPPIVDQRIQYPTNVDVTPVDIQSLLDPIEDKPVGTKANEAAQHQKTLLEEVLSLNENVLPASNESSPPINFEVAEALAKMDITREPSPPPVRADIQDLVAVNNQVSDSISGQTIELQDQLLKAQAPLEVHISTSMMDNFMRLAKSNTDRNLETCGVLAGSLKHRKFYVTALIIPKQESTSDSCNTTNEEDVFEYQDKNSLFSLGWIHTHPTQSCFMSSIDIHTQYSYQVMLPEAIAIVMAPRDGSRKHGIFRLTVPGGMSVVKKCPHSGFHPHQSPPDGGPIYKSCTDIYMNPNLKFDVADLR